MLKYTGTEFEDKLLSCGPAPDFDRSCWFDQKFKLGLDFPNLPYFIDGDIKVCRKGKKKYKYYLSYYTLHSALSRGQNVFEKFMNLLYH